MTDSMIVEAIRSATAAGGAQAADPSAAAGVQAAADPSAVSRFEAAMATPAVSAADPIPFVSEATAAWRSAQANRQGLVHRIRSLVDMGRMHSVSAPELVELQYEVMNMSFQQEIVTKVADKSSTAVQTLIKNQ